MLPFQFHLGPRLGALCGTGRWNLDVKTYVGFGVTTSSKDGRVPDPTYIEQERPTGLDEKGRNHIFRGGLQGAYFIVWLSVRECDVRAAAECDAPLRGRSAASAPTPPEARQAAARRSSTLRSSQTPAVRVACGREASVPIDARVFRSQLTCWFETRLRVTLGQLPLNDLLPGAHLRSVGSVLAWGYAFLGTTPCGGDGRGAIAQ